MMCDGCGGGVIDAVTSQCPRRDGGRKGERELSPPSSKKKRETVETKCQRWELRTDGVARERGRRVFFFFFAKTLSGVDVKGSSVVSLSVIAA